MFFWEFHVYVIYLLTQSSSFSNWQVPFYLSFFLLFFFISFSFFSFSNWLLSSFIYFTFYALCLSFHSFCFRIGCVFSFSFRGSPLSFLHSFSSPTICFPFSFFIHLSLSLTFDLFDANQTILSFPFLDNSLTIFYCLVKT